MLTPRDPWCVDECLGQQTFALRIISTHVQEERHTYKPATHIIYTFLHTEILVVVAIYVVARRGSLDLII